MWKVVSARLRGSETELEAMGEDTDGLVKSTSKLQSLVKGITGFDIMKDENTYKDIYDIVLGISKTWKDLNDIDRASLLEALAGKMQSNSLAAAFANPDILVKSYQEAMDSAGSAAEEEKKYQQSVQYSIDQTKAKLEELSADLLSSDFLKGAIDAGGKLIDILDGIVKSGNAIPAVATAIAAAFSFKNVGIFKQDTLKNLFSGIDTEVVKPFSDAKTVIDLYNESVKDNSLTQEHWNDILSICDDSLSDYLTKIKGQEATLTGYNTSLQGSITGFKKVHAAISEYNKLSGSNSEKQKEYCEAINLTNSKLGSYLTNLNGSKAGMLGYASSLVGATLKTVALQVATTALNAAITMGASLIVTGIITAISNWIRQDEILAEKAETAKQKIDELNNNYKEHSQLVSDSAKRYAELAQGVDQLSGKNLSLNDDDYKEFLDLSNQLAEAFPTLSRHYDENGNAILQLSGNVDTIVGSLNNLIEAERALKNQEIADELPTVYKNANNKSDDYKKQIDELKEQRKTLIDSLGDVQSDDFSKNFIDGLEKSMISVEGENLETLSKMKDDYLKILKDANIDYEELTPDYENKDGVDVPVRFNIKINSSEEDIEKAKKTIKANVENLASEYEGDISELNDKIQSVQDKNKANWSSLTGSIAAWLNTEDSYKIMSDDMQSTIQNIVNSLDWGELDFSSWEDAKQYIQDNILSLFQTSDGKDVLKKIEVMFGIQTQFNNGEITVNEYQEKLRTFLDEISTLAPDTQKAIKLIFGISTDEDGTTTSSVDTMVNNVKSKLKDKFDDKV